MSELAERRQNAVAELFNMGASNAAEALSQMVQEVISLSAPKVLFLSRGEAAKQICAQGGKPFSSVQEEFSGAVRGEALLVFPEDKGLDLVRALMQQEASAAEFTGLEKEVLVEVGNVVINACLGALGSRLEEEISTAFPVYLNGDCELVLARENAGNSASEVMQCCIDFSLQEQKKDIQGFFMLRLDEGSVEQLASKIEGRMPRQ